MGFKANTLQVYGLVAACMPDGITGRAIRDELLADLPEQTISNKLTNLSEHGYLSCSRRGRHCVWRTTDKPLPLTKTPRAPMAQPDDGGPERLFPRSPTPQCPPPGVPSSVFDLARTLA